jgi:hypothetical protein
MRFTFTWEQYLTHAQPGFKDKSCYVRKTFACGPTAPVRFHIAWLLVLWFQLERFHTGIECGIVLVAVFGQ